MAALISLVSACDRRAPGHLHSFDIGVATARVRQQLRRAEPHELWIGGWDFSLNEDADGRWPAHWQPHCCLYTPANDGLSIAKTLSRWYPSDPMTPRPLHVRKVDDPFAALSYVCKPIFFRRVTYQDGRGRQNTRKNLPLKPAQLRELVLFLSGLPPTARLIIRCKFARNTDPLRGDFRVQ